MGKIKAIIEMPNSTLEGCSDWQSYYAAGGTEGYIVRQLLIWNEIYKMRDELGSLYCTSDNSAVFKGWDLNSLTSSGYPLVRVAKEIATSFDAPEAYIPSGPTYKAVIQNSSSIQYDSSKGVYYATFDVTVKETHTGSIGGVFHFSNMSGCNVYPSGSNNAINTSNNFTISTSTTSFSFRAEGSYSQMISMSGGKRGFGVWVEAISNSGNSTQSRVEYGLFKDSTDAKNQTFVAPYIESQPRFDGDDDNWTATTGTFELTKVLRHSDGSTQPESGLRFRIYPSSYASYDAATGNRWEGRTDVNGKLTFSDLPIGEYKLVQVDVPAGTLIMNPNPATVTVSGGTQYGTYYNDEIVGYLQINKKVQSTADAAAGTAAAAGDGSSVRSRCSGSRMDLLLWKDRQHRQVLRRVRTAEAGRSGILDLRVRRGEYGQVLHGVRQAETVRINYGRSVFL